jgi:hypothetical protein
VLARKAEYRQRFTVERSFAWLGNFRRLLIRWEYLYDVYASFFAVAIMTVCVRRLTRIEAEEEGKGAPTRNGIIHEVAGSSRSSSRPQDCQTEPCNAHPVEEHVRDSKTREDEEEQEIRTLALDSATRLRHQGEHHDGSKGAVEEQQQEAYLVPRLIHQHEWKEGEQERKESETRPIRRLAGFDAGIRPLHTIVRHVRPLVASS